MVTTNKDPYALNDNNEKLLRVVSKFLRRDKKKIIDSIDLFSGLNYYEVRILECVSQIKKEKLISVLLCLEYLLQFDDIDIQDLKK